MRRLKAIPTRHGKKMPHTNRQDGQHRGGWTASGWMDDSPPLSPPYINEKTRDNTSGKLQQ
ncbi:MAG: hypothetical protein Q4E44_08275 [bacterium]|nr:hypothetical protein [bacterium]